MFWSSTKSVKVCVYFKLDPQQVRPSEIQVQVQKTIHQTFLFKLKSNFKSNSNVELRNSFPSVCFVRVKLPFVLRFTNFNDIEMVGEICI